MIMISNHSYASVLENNVILETNDHSKERLTNWLKLAVTKVQNAATQLNNGEPLPQDLPEVWHLCECLDKTLLHGLKQLQYGYWSCVREFTHPNCRLHLEGLTNIRSNLGRGRAWLCQALNDCSLESFFSSFLKNPTILGRYYSKPALLRDIQRMQVILTLMAGLEFVSFNMPVDVAYLDNRGFSCFLSTSDPDSEPDTLSASSGGMESKSPSATPVSMQSLADDETELMSVESAVEMADDSTLDDPLDSPPDSPFPQCINSSRSEKRDHVNHLINLDAELSDHETSSVDVVHTKVVRRRKKLSDMSPTSEFSENGNGSETDSNKFGNLICDNVIDEEISDEPSNLDLSLNDYGETMCNELPIKNLDHDSVCQDLSVTENTNVSADKGLDWLGERGTPEGQEDPVACTINDAAACRVETLAKSLEETSIYDSQTLKDSSKHDTSEGSIQHCQNLCQWASQNSVASNETSASSLLSQDLALEFNEEKTFPDGSLRVHDNILLYLTLEVFQQDEEHLYKIFLASLRRWNAQLEHIFVVITDHGIYVLSEGNETRGKFKTKFMLLFKDINKLTVNLNYHSFVIQGTNKKCKCKIFTGSDSTTRSILSNLDVQMRRSKCKILPTVSTWPEAQLKHLQKLVCKNLFKTAEEVELQYFACVQWENYMGLSPVSTPAGPVKEGFLMYRGKFSDSAAWRPAYFHLKAGVLYCFKDQDSTLPTFYFQLHYPHFHGCRRLHGSSHRPHSFELRLQGQEKLLLAAPNDYEASSWQQAIMQMVSLFGHLNDVVSGEVMSCNLVLADHHFFVINELHEDQVASVQACAALADLSAVCVDQECPTCFVLEFESGEANSCGGEWIVIFADSEERDQALSVISSLWEHLFQLPLNIASVKDLSIWSRCREHSQQQKMTIEHLISLFSTS